MINVIGNVMGRDMLNKCWEKNVQISSLFFNYIRLNEISFSIYVIYKCENLILTALF